MSGALEILKRRHAPAKEEIVRIVMPVRLTADVRQERQERQEEQGQIEEGQIEEQEIESAPRIIKKGSIVRQEQVIDKSSENIIDRAEMLANIRARKGKVMVAIKKSPKIVESVEGEGEGEGIVIETVQGQGEGEEGDIETNRVVIENAAPKKTGRKIKLVEQPKTKKSGESVPDKPDIATTIKTIKRIKLNVQTSRMSQPSARSPIEILEPIEMLQKRQPKPFDGKNPGIVASAYYANNRTKFIEFIAKMFLPYRDELLKQSNNLSCDRGNEVGEDFSLSTHQRIVRDYMDILTPYRGLLLYHGLGSGKTCSSIAIAEGLKTYKKVIVMTPASLQMNYLEELKKCGDTMYKKNQYWEFIDTRKSEELLAALASVLNLPESMISKNGGAWMVNAKKPSNYEELTPGERESLDAQLDKMIRAKYEFINYNGIRQEHLKAKTNNYTRNLFDNCVVIVDEAHNLISRIVNKLKRPTSMYSRMYEYLLSAKNAKVIMLTGTPVINYPNEIGIMYNILRGYIKTWTIPVSSVEKVTLDTLKRVFGINDVGDELGMLFDSLEYNQYKKVITITRNPFGFTNVYKEAAPPAGKGKGTGSGSMGVEYAGVQSTYQTQNESGLMSDEDFEHRVIERLKASRIDVTRSAIKINQYKALPDKLEDFTSMFIDSKTLDIKNAELFMRRILGLTSYFRSAQEQLMPEYNPDKDFHLVEVQMSDYQYGLYEKVRAKEMEEEENLVKRKRRKPNAEDNVNQVNQMYEDVSSTYRIFSRAFSNFVFPDTIKRPMPSDSQETDVKIKKAAKGMQVGVVGNTNADIIDRIAKEMALHKKVAPRRGKEEGKEEGKEGEDADAPDTTQTMDENILDAELPKEEEDIVIDSEHAVVANEADVDARHKQRLKMLQYQRDINHALEELKKNALSYLTPDGLQKYSPKFLQLLNNLISPENEGLNLVYSQFRTLEGIGIIKLILETNGFAEFRIKQNHKGQWFVDMAEEDRGKPTFALYTGTETAEQKEIIRRIYNSEWKYVPTTIVDEISKISRNNLYGEVIKVLMITASGSEGINLRNVRRIHIVEPYWNNVRKEQIIGRGRRICSHSDLPLSKRKMEVYMYVSSSSPSSAEEGIVEETTEEYLLKISERKGAISDRMKKLIESSSMDCVLHGKDCYGLSSSSSSSASLSGYVYKGSYDEDSKYASSSSAGPSSSSSSSEMSTSTSSSGEIVRMRRVQIRGKEYAMSEKGEMYDYEGYKRGQLIKL